MNSFLSALFVYAQNITRLQGQNVRIPVILNILFKIRAACSCRKHATAGATRFQTAAERRNQPIQVGPSRFPSNYSVVEINYFHFSRRQIGVCHCDQWLPDIVAPVGRLMHLPVRGGSPGSKQRFTQRAKGEQEKMGNVCEEHPIAALVAAGECRRNFKTSKQITQRSAI
jgi:hypothetical protein